MSLLADLAARRDAEIVAVVDPGGNSLGAAIAEVMGIPVWRNLAHVDLEAAEYFVHPAGNAEINDLISEAQRLGLRALPTSELRALLRDPAAAPRRIQSQARDLGFLERETESIHRSLSRVEEALDRESLLRWLLSLATRAVGAGSGSIMLFDERSDELYIAFAYGLSEAVAHRTRVRLGEGIAGRVATTRQAELIQGIIRPGAGRERPSIASAICVPLTWEERLLGVLNVSANEGDPALGEKELTALSSLSHRFGSILDRFLRFQAAHDNELIRLADRQLGEIAENHTDLKEVLPAWCAWLAVAMKAEQLSLALLCADGNLLTAEGNAAGEMSCDHENLENAALAEVLR